MNNHLDVIDTLAERSRRRNLPFQIEGKSPHRTFVVEPADASGFPIYVTEEDGKWLAAFGENGVHDQVPEATNLFELVAFALSDSCRLREIWRGTFWQRGLLERKSTTGWERVTETGLLFFPFWRGKRETIRQNKVIRD